MSIPLPYLDRSYLEAWSKMPLGERGNLHDRWVPSSLYKYVDEIHAESVNSGSVKFGDFATYSSIENGREDEYEGMATLAIDRRHILTPDSKKELGILAMFGFDIQAPYMEMEGNVIQVGSAPLAISCYSLVPDSLSLLMSEKPQAIFKIGDVAGYLFQIAEKVDRDRMAAGPINYCDRTIRSYDQVGFLGPHPFYKDKIRKKDGYSFENEKEYRIGFPKPENIRTKEPYAPDGNIAKYLTRIR